MSSIHNIARSHLAVLANETAGTGVVQPLEAYIDRAERIEKEHAAAANKAPMSLMCTMCFASDVDGSWGETAIPGHCFNCGAGGTTVELPDWAVKNVRQNAAWVGRNYYPNEDTKDEYKELQALRRAIGRYPGRTVTKDTRDDGSVVWRLRQEGLGVRRFVTAFASVPVLPGETEEQALKRTGDKLPWAGDEP